MMLDEPSLHLLWLRKWFECFNQVHKEWGLSILLIEQNAVQALEMIDEAIILENRRLSFNGTKEQVEEIAYLEKENN